MAQHLAVQGAVQTHSWRSYSEIFPSDAEVSLVAVFHSTNWRCCQWRDPFPLLPDPAPPPCQAWEQQFMWHVVNWTGGLIQVYANSMGRKKEKEKKGLIPSLLPAGSRFL